MNEVLTAIKAAIESGIARALAEGGSEESRIKPLNDRYGYSSREIFGYEVFYGYSDKNALLFSVTEEIEALEAVKPLGSGKNHRFCKWLNQPGMHLKSHDVRDEFEIADKPGFDYETYCFLKTYEFLEKEAEIYGPYRDDEDEEF